MREKMHKALLLPDRVQGKIVRMGGGRTQSTKSYRSSASSAADSRPAFDGASSSPRHVLPKDLANAIRQLGDEDFDRLLGAVVAEKKRRGGNPRASDKPRQNQLTEGVVTSLPTGQLNAIRAAFKAGVKPSQIARQFGLSQSDVRNALASVNKER
jgi:hypothetical protein